MIVSVRGVLEAVGPDWVHLQVGGVTLQVFVPSSDIAGLGSLGAPVRLYTHFRLRDEQPVLYGFTTPASLQMFLMLTSVSGVGPRHSLAILSTLGAGRLHQAIASEDAAALASAPGVGRRTAGRIILELKGKLETSGPGVVPGPVADDLEVIAALTALGYSTNEARRAVGGLQRDPGLTLEDRVRLALQQMGAGR